MANPLSNVFSAEFKHQQTRQIRDQMCNTVFELLVDMKPSIVEWAPKCVIFKHRNAFVAIWMIQ